MTLSIRDFVNGAELGQVLDQLFQANITFGYCVSSKSESNVVKSKVGCSGRSAA